MSAEVVQKMTTYDKIQNLMQENTADMATIKEKYDAMNDRFQMTHQRGQLTHSKD